MAQRLSAALSACAMRACAQSPFLPPATKRDAFNGVDIGHWVFLLDPIAGVDTCIHVVSEAAFAGVLGHADRGSEFIFPLAPGGIYQ